MGEISTTLVLYIFLSLVGIWSYLFSGAPIWATSVGKFLFRLYLAIIITIVFVALFNLLPKSIRD